ncbi:MAG: hypothetical protein AB8F34_02660 [Akkermansiaceae bacterium]
MENPYEPPKVVQEPPPPQHDFFVRAQKYQWRGFYVGLVLSIVGAIFSRANESIAEKAFGLLGILGVILLFLSLGSILPLAIWGFVKGYRESRKG